MTHTSDPPRGEGLDIQELSVSYREVKALRYVSFGVAPRCVTSVLGANGAGKTTLLRALTGLVHPEEGSAHYRGTDITRLPTEEVVRHGVAHVPEGRQVIQELTVEENLRLGSLWLRNREDTVKGLALVYDLFAPLSRRQHVSAFSLSGGERQMLAIARALMSRPSLLLLDEPSLGLAPRVTAQIMALLLRLTRESDISVLLVEQNARSALSISDRAVVLSLGQVVADEPAEVIAADAGLRRHYLGF
ncbi:MAG: ABC transporter ATP-binding protein [Acidimicrobiales bacterium]